MAMKTLAAMKQTTEVLSAVKTNPTRKIPIESSKTVRRPNISENLPVSSVEAAPGKAGSAINQGKSGIPLNSLIIPGWAIMNSGLFLQLVAGWRTQAAAAYGLRATARHGMSSVLIARRSSIA
jgi:hypothetical protein